MPRLSSRLFAVVAICCFSATGYFYYTYYSSGHIENAELPDAKSLIVQGFEEQLIAIGNPEYVQTQALQKAIDVYMAQTDSSEVKPLTQFLDNYPDSAWRVALQTNLGLIHYRHGAFSQAFIAWEDAWKRGASATEPKAKAMVDRAYGELVRMHARIGHADQVEALLKEAAGRELIGPATEAVAGAKEGLWQMRTNPGVSYLCGPMALKNVLLAKNPNNSEGLAFLDTVRSGVKGVDLAEVNQLAKTVGLNYTMAYREDKNAPLPLPAVVHWKVNHYAAVIGEKDGLYHVKDPTFGSNDLWIPKAVLEKEADGYFMLPESEVKNGWRHVELTEAKTIYGMGYTSSFNQDATRLSDITNNCVPCSDAGSIDLPQSPLSPALSGLSLNATSSSSSANIGMPTYDVHSLLVSLTIKDSPVGYTPANGTPIYPTLIYNQREARQTSNPIITNLGPKWSLNWFGYVEDNSNAPIGSDVVLHVRGGGAIVYTGYNSVTREYERDKYEQSVLRVERENVGTVANPIFKVLKYQRILADGTKEDYGNDTGPNGVRYWLLTSVTDPIGNTIKLNYDTRNRLGNISGPEGLKTFFSYGNTRYAYAITKITDPFNRFATITYDATGRLETITDAEGMRSLFEYQGASDFISSMTTPYGTTRFAYGESMAVPMQRWLNITDPLGKTERTEYKEDVYTRNGIPSPLGPYPAGMAFTHDTDNPDHVDDRNTYYWDKRAYALYAGDYTKADIKHWLRNTSPVNESVLQAVKRPLENPIWFNYPNQPNSYTVGTQHKAAFVGRVLDDGSSQVTKVTRNELGNITKLIYPDGNEIVYEYDTTPNNETRLLKIKRLNPAGGYNTLAEYKQYNSLDLPTQFLDARLKLTKFSYSPVGRLETITDAKNNKTTYHYDTKHRLVFIKDANDTVIKTYGYSNASGANIYKIASITNANNYKVDLLYDKLDRLKRVTYPDNTYIEYSYDKLDVATVRDQLGNLKKFTYDGARNLEKVVLTNPANAQSFINSYEYYENGDVKLIKDGNNRITNIGRDTESRTNTVLRPTGNPIAYAYENTTSRLAGVTDPNLGFTRYQYDIADRLNAVTDPRGVITTYEYDYAGRQTKEISPDRGTIVTDQYDGNNNLLTKKQFNTAINNIVTQTDFIYDEINRLTSINYLNSPNDNVALTYDDITAGNFGVNRLTGITNQAAAILYQYDQSGNVVMQANQITARNPDVVKYAYNPNNTLNQIIYPSGHIINYSYNSNFQVQQVTFQEDAQSVPLMIANNVNYQPFGPMKGFTYGNALSLTRQFDQNYLLTDESITSNVRNVHYDYDLLDNVKKIIDNVTPSRTQDFQYDMLSRLKTASQTGGYGLQSFDYDAGNNRTIAPNQSVAYASSNNKILTQVQPQSMPPDEFNLANDFCKTLNPSSRPACNNNVWSYGWSTQTGTTFNRSTYSFVRDGLNGWGGNLAAEGNPSILHNGTNATLYLAGFLAVPPNGVLVHPGPAGENHVVRWTAPNSGQYNVAATFTRADTGFTDAHVLVTANNTQLLNQTLDATNPSASLSTNITLSAGQTLDFTIGASIDNYFGDSTALSVHIKPAQTSAAPLTYAYDQNGNVKSKTTSNGDGWYYTYSARNQLVKAEQQINGVRTTKATYTYNGKGERVSKTGVGTTYFTRGLAGELLEEVTVNNNTVTDRKEYIYLNGEMVAVNQLVPGLVAPRAEEVIVDNVNAVASGSAAWKRTTASTDYGSDYLHFANSNASQPSGRAILTWTPTLAGGDYEVFAWWVAGSNHYSQVPYIITHSGGSTTVYKDQRVSGGQWVSLGRYRFNAGSSGNVRVSSDGVNTTVADAVRFVNLRTPVAGFITNTYYLHNNHLGAPVAATKPNGQVAWRAHYEPFGAVATQTDVDGDGVAFNLNVRFPGQYYDQETGLHYNYFRDYDPSTGRYLESDPIGLEGGLNTYAYVGGNPINKIDPYGLCTNEPKEDCIQAALNTYSLEESFDSIVGFGVGTAIFGGAGQGLNKTALKPRGGIAGGGPSGGYTSYSRRFLGNGVGRTIGRVGIGTVMKFSGILGAGVGAMMEHAEAIEEFLKCQNRNQND